MSLKVQKQIYCGLKVFVLTVFMILLFLSSWLSSSSSSTGSNRTTYVVSMHQDESHAPTLPGASGSTTYNDVTHLKVMTGELPGYTGWARPDRTLAGYFKVVEPPSTHDSFQFVVRLNCTHPLCQHGGSKFYVRSYGPSVVAGRTTDHRNGSYDIFWPIGTEHEQFTVEVVLTFSSTPEYKNFPLRDAAAAPAYEGHLIPGFPLLITSNKTIIATPDRICSSKDLYVSSSLGGYSKGRWVVVDRVSNPTYFSNETDEFSVQGYQHGGNALGIFMNYQPYHCRFPLLLDQAKNWFQSCESPKKPTRLLFIGDSVMKMQEHAFVKAKIHGIQITFIKTHTGLHNILHNVESALSDKALRDESEDLIIGFNSGLHDIAQLCSPISKRRRDKMNLDLHNERWYSCVDHYKRLFTKLAKIISTFPAKLRVFQTTSAGWMKYGNYGFAWSPYKQQILPFDTSFAEHFNEIAFDVLKPFDNIQIVDAYWLMLARPDNREVDADQSIGKHLVHPGNEVLGALTSIWMTVFAETLDEKCFAEYEKQYSRRGSRGKRSSENKYR